MLYLEKYNGFQLSLLKQGLGFGFFCHLGSSQLRDKEKGTSLLTKPPWGLPDGSFWAALVKAPDVMVIQELPQLQCNVLGPGSLYPHPIFPMRSPEKDSTEGLWQSRFGWDITLWWSHAERATSAELLAFLRNQWQAQRSQRTMQNWFLWFFKRLWNLWANIFYARALLEDL